MKAATTRSYGSPDVLETKDLPTPAIGDHDVLIEVHASPVTQGDRRLRSADFPGMGWLPGRLMTGLVRPRHPVQGTCFAGRVTAVGREVTRFAPGDDVFGSCMHGAHAEYLAMPEGGPVARMPAGLSFDEVAAAPYELLTAIVFLRELGGLQAGERVLILGAAGGVGRAAVQLAKHLGADVTGVCSARSAALVRDLGADRVIDYATTDFAAEGHRYDLILDTAGVSGFRRARGSLTPRGRYLSLLVSTTLILWAAWTRLAAGPRAGFGVALPSAERMEQLRALLEQGAVRPVVDRRYPLEQIGEAHARVESGHPQGSVVVTMAPAHG